MARIELGTFASRDTISIPTAIFEQAASKLEAQAEQLRREAEAVAADTLRRTNTKRAFVMRRFQKSLTILLRGAVR
jgi:hypothetical protein